MARRTSIGLCRRVTFLAWARTSESRELWKSIFPVELSWVIPLGRLDPPRGVTAGIDPDFQKFGTGVPPTIALPGFHR